MSGKGWHDFKCNSVEKKVVNDIIERRVREYNYYSINPFIGIYSINTTEYKKI